MSTFDDLINKLANLRGELQRGLIADAEDITRPVVGQAQVYGPELPDQVYERTYALREGWENSEVQPKATSAGVTLSHTNPVDYAIFVQGPDEQAALFENRWDDLQDVANKAEEATVSRATGTIVAELGRLF